MSSDSVTRPLPGRLLRLTLQIYSNSSSTSEGREQFAREYLVKAANLNAKNGIEKYQQVFTPNGYRKVLEDMNRRNDRGWTVDDHDLTIEFYFRHFDQLTKVTQDPDFKELQAAEGPYVNLVHTVATLGWVETYVDNSKVVNVENGKSAYPPWAELHDLTTAFPARPAEVQAAKPADGTTKERAYVLNHENKGSSAKTEAAWGRNRP